MNLIAAADENWGIGKNGGLLAHISGDMKYFRETTKGKVVVMGRKTLESFPGGKPLKNRVNIVLTQNQDFAPEGVTVCHSIEETLKTLKQYPKEDVFIIGGGMIDVYKRQVTGASGNAVSFYCTGTIYHADSEGAGAPASQTRPFKY